MSLFAELQRRKVFKVGGAYLVVAWLAVQAVSIGFPAFDAPPWALRIFILVALLGFPIALVLAWAFDITDQGVQFDASKVGSKRLLSVAALLVALALGWYFLGQPSFRKGEVGTPVPGKSIAVLPFENLSDDKANEYFAEGVQDEILTRLAKIRELKVISRTSTQKYKSAPDNLRQIAAQLGVANILEGSVQKANDQVRVTVQLINATTDEHLWADTYDRKLTDIFAVESDIATTIADTLQARLTAAEHAVVSAQPTQNTQAHQLYLQGRFFWNKRTAADLHKSIDYFHQAIAQDAQYAQAYAALALAQVLLPSYDGGAPKEWYPQAENAAKHALALDGTSSDAHVVLGVIRVLDDFNFSAAQAEFERAIALDPNNATARHWLAFWVFAPLGQSERGIAEMHSALELDPLSLIINKNLGMVHFYGRRYPDAIAQLHKTLELDGAFYPAHGALGEALELSGSSLEAVAEYQKSVALTDDSGQLALLGHIYGVLGKSEDARQIVERLRQRRAQRYTEAYDISLVYLGLGDREQALDWLERDYADRDGDALALIRVDPLLDPLHGDPRFEALAEKIVPRQQFGERQEASK